MRVMSSNLIWPLIGVIVICAVIYGFYQQVKTGSKVPAIVEALIDPYARVLATGNYEEAYKRFTSKDFQKRYSLDEFIKAQEINRAEYGVCKSILSKMEEFYNFLL